jgi:hypothetical protein
MLRCLAVNKSTNIAGKYTTGYCKNKAKAAAVTIMIIIIIITIILDEKYGEILPKTKGRTSSKEQDEEIYNTLKQ